MNRPAEILSKPRYGFPPFRGMLFSLALLLLALFLNGCGGGGGGGTDQQPPAIPGSFTISGRITLLNGAALPGIQVNVDGAAATISTTTNPDGSYSVAGLATGAYTVTPVSPANPAYTFAPTSRNVTITSADQANQDFTATANTGTIVITF